MDLDTLWEETLAAMAAATAQDGATTFGSHAGTEAELTLARALGRLIGALHVVKVLKELGRKEWAAKGRVSTCEFAWGGFFRKDIAQETDSPYLQPSIEEPFGLPDPRLGS